MPKNCYECEKYPMCSQYQDIVKSINNHGILKSTNTVLISVASHCKYYKEVKEVTKDD